MGTNQSHHICGPTREFACTSLESYLKWHNYNIQIYNGPDPHTIIKMADKLLSGITFLENKRPIWKLTAPFNLSGSYSWKKGVCRVELLLNQQTLDGYGPTMNVALVSLLSQIVHQDLDNACIFQTRQLYKVHGDDLRYEQGINPQFRIVSSQSSWWSFFQYSNPQIILMQNDQEHPIWIGSII
jgi:hypothetical protein